MIPEDIKAQALRDYAKDYELSTRAIAAKYGISVVTLDNWRRKAGLTRAERLPWCPEKHRRFDDESDLKLQEDACQST